MTVSVRTARGMLITFKISSNAEEELKGRFSSGLEGASAIK